ncbi:MAG: hypothetical protein R3B70_12065 [Polyangiaceae bacterium]
MALLSSPGALTTSVSPSADRATRSPNRSFALGIDDAFTYTCCDHTPPLFTNTYTAPEPAAELLTARLPFSSACAGLLLSPFFAPTASVAARGQRHAPAE